MFLPLYFVFFVDATAFQLQIIGTTLCECFYLMSYVKSSLSSGTSYSCRQSAEKKHFTTITLFIYYFRGMPK